MKSTTYSNKTLINYIKTPHYLFQYHKIKQLYSLFLAKLTNEKKCEYYINLRIFAGYAVFYPAIPQNYKND